MPTTSTAAIRALPVPDAAAVLLDTLLHPQQHDALLVDLLADRGLRDAWLVVAARNGYADHIAPAALVAYSRAAAVGADKYAAQGVMALGYWFDGDAAFAASIAMNIPDHEPSARLAGLVLRAINRGFDPNRYIAFLVAMDLEGCLEFTG